MEVKEDKKKKVCVKSEGRKKREKRRGKCGK
jgi:hypothetical protein